jgi:AraC-like DNA-binding protein
MNETSVWDVGLQLVAHSYHAKRSGFTYAVETYAEWAWLALEGGSFNFRIGRGQGNLSGECYAGAWVLCPPGQPFYRSALSEVSFHFARIAVMGEADLKTGVHTVQSSTRLRDNFAALREANYRPQAAEWKAHLILDLLRASHWEEIQQGAAVCPDAPIQQVCQLIEQNFHRKISLEALAQEMRLTPPAFSRRFRAAVGQSPQSFLLEKRLDHARHLLLSTDLNIEVVAQRSGFSNGFYFSRLWTKRFHIAPSQFRRIHQV